MQSIPQTTSTSAALVQCELRHGHSASCCHNSIKVIHSSAVTHILKETPTLPAVSHRLIYGCVINLSIAVGSANSCENFCKRRPFRLGVRRTVAGVRHFLAINLQLMAAKWVWMAKPPGPLCACAFCAPQVVSVCLFGMRWAATRPQRCWWPRISD